MIRSIQGILMAGLVTLATFGTAANARAAAPKKNESPEMVEAVTEAHVKAVLGEIGEGFAKVKPGMYRTNVGGVNVVMLVDNGVVTLATGFTDLGVSLKEVNTWNRSKRFARLYLDEADDPILMADLEMTSGVTLDNLKDWAKTYKLCLTHFRTAMKGKMH